MNEALLLFLETGHRFSGAQAGNLFGWRCFKYQNKPFVFFDEASQQAMVFKLGPTQRASALGLPGTHVFNPGEKGKPMKNWVVVPYYHHPHWATLAEMAFLNLCADLPGHQ